eukprot:400182-Pelagomonas_calceolata.AAC.1
MRHIGRRAMSPLHHKAVEYRVLMGIWSTPSGNKLVAVHNRMGMKLASKFNATTVKSKLFVLVKGVFNITGPANTQKDSMKSHSFCTNKFAGVCMLPPPTVVQASCTHST